MSIYTSARRDAEAMRDAVVATVVATGQLVPSAETAAEAFAKGARAAAATAPTLYGPTGAVVSGPARSSGGASGSSRGSGSAAAGSGRGGEAFVIDEFGNVRSLGALALDATGLPVFDTGRRVSGQSAAAGGGNAPGRLGIGADQLGNRPGYRPGYAAGGSGSTSPTQTFAGGKATVTRGEAIIADELRSLRRDIRDLSRNDNGAQLRRQGFF